MLLSMKTMSLKPLSAENKNICILFNISKMEVAAS